MSCNAGDDRRLLFLLHGQLAFIGKALAMGHLMTCAGCRARYRDFLAASSGLMQVSTPVHGIGRRNRIDNVFQPMLVLRSVLPAVFIVTAVGIMLLGWSRFQAHASTQRGAAAARGVPLRCRPVLPADHCR